MTDLNNVKNFLEGREAEYDGVKATIKSVDKVTNDVIATLDLDTGAKSLRVALKKASARKLKLPQDCLDYLETLTGDFAEYEKQVELDEKLYIERIQAERQAERERRKKEQEEAKALEKYNNTLANLNTMASGRLVLSPETLNWLKENTLHIKAVIPSNLESWFNKTFGDMPKAVVDENKKTSGGYKMQFNIACKLTFKKNVDIPAELLKFVKNNTIPNTAFIIQLILNYNTDYGFAFN